MDPNSYCRRVKILLSALTVLSSRCKSSSDLTQPANEASLDEGPLYPFFRSKHHVYSEKMT